MRNILGLPSWVGLCGEDGDFLVYALLVCVQRMGQISWITFRWIKQSSLSFGKPLDLSTFGGRDVGRRQSDILTGRSQRRVSRCNLGV